MPIESVGYVCDVVFNNENHTKQKYAIWLNDYGSAYLPITLKNSNLFHVLGIEN